MNLIGIIRWIEAEARDWESAISNRIISSQDIFLYLICLGKVTIMCCCLFLLIMLI